MYRICLPTCSGLSICAIIQSRLWIYGCCSGIEPLQQETDALIATLRQREQDHINWLTELEASIRQDRPFTLTTDPHKCAFGKWYDNYHTDNIALDIVMRQFDIPHKNIHALGITLCDLVQQGNKALALQTLEEARAKHFTELVKVFARAYNTVRNTFRETVIVVETAEKQFGVTVDRLESVELLAEPPEALPNSVYAGNTRYTTHTFRRAHSAIQGLMVELDAIPC